MECSQNRTNSLNKSASHSDFYLAALWHACAISSIRAVHGIRSPDLLSPDNLDSNSKCTTDSAVAGTLACHPTDAWMISHVYVRQLQQEFHGSLPNTTPSVQDSLANVRICRNGWKDAVQYQPSAWGMARLDKYTVWASHTVCLLESIVLSETSPLERGFSCWQRKAGKQFPISSYDDIDANRHQIQRQKILRYAKEVGNLRCPAMEINNKLHPKSLKLQHFEPYSGISNALKARGHSRKLRRQGVHVRIPVSLLYAGDIFRELGPQFPEVSWLLSSCGNFVFPITLPCPQFRMPEAVMLQKALDLLIWSEAPLQDAWHSIQTGACLLSLFEAADNAFLSGQPAVVKDCSHTHSASDRLKLTIDWLDTEFLRLFAQNARKETLHIFFHWAALSIKYESMVQCRDSMKNSIATRMAKVIQGTVIQCLTSSQAMLQLTACLQTSASSTMSALLLSCYQLAAVSMVDVYDIHSNHVCYDRNHNGQNTLSGCCRCCLSALLSCKHILSNFAVQSALCILHQPSHAQLLLSVFQHQETSINAQSSSTAPSESLTCALSLPPLWKKCVIKSHRLLCIASGSDVQNAEQLSDRQDIFNAHNGMGSSESGWILALPNLISTVKTLSASSDSLCPACKHCLSSLKDTLSGILLLACGLFKEGLSFFAQSHNSVENFMRSFPDYRKDRFAQISGKLTDTANGLHGFSAIFMEQNIRQMYMPSVTLTLLRTIESSEMLKDWSHDMNGFRRASNLRVERAACAAWRRKSSGDARHKKRLSFTSWISLATDVTHDCQVLHVFMASCSSPEGQAWLFASFDKCIALVKACKHASWNVSNSIWALINFETYSTPSSAVNDYTFQAKLNTSFRNVLTLLLHYAWAQGHLLSKFSEILMQQFGSKSECSSTSSNDILSVDCKWLKEDLHAIQAVQRECTLLWFACLDTSFALASMSCFCPNVDNDRFSALGCMIEPFQFRIQIARSSIERGLSQTLTICDEEIMSILPRMAIPRLHLLCKTQLPSAATMSRNSCASRESQKGGGVQVGSNVPFSRLAEGHGGIFQCSSYTIAFGLARARRSRGKQPNFEECHNAGRKKAAPKLQKEAHASIRKDAEHLVTLILGCENLAYWVDDRPIQFFVIPESGFQNLKLYDSSYANNMQESPSVDVRSRDRHKDVLLCSGSEGKVLLLSENCSPSTSVYRPLQPAGVHQMANKGDDGQPLPTEKENLILLLDSVSSFHVLCQELILYDMHLQAVETLTWLLKICLTICQDKLSKHVNAGDGDLSKSIFTDFDDIPNSPPNFGLLEKFMHHPASTIPAAQFAKISRHASGIARMKHWAFASLFQFPLCISLLLDISPSVIVQWDSLLLPILDIIHMSHSTALYRTGNFDVKKIVYLCELILPLFNDKKVVMQVAEAFAVSVQQLGRHARTPDLVHIASQACSTIISQTQKVLNLTVASDSPNQLLVRRRNVFVHQDHDLSNSSLASTLPSNIPLPRQVSRRQQNSFQNSLAPLVQGHLKHKKAAYSVRPNFASETNVATADSSMPAEENDSLDNSSLTGVQLRSLKALANLLPDPLPGKDGLSSSFSINSVIGPCSQEQGRVFLSLWKQLHWLPSREKAWVQESLFVMQTVLFPTLQTCIHFNLWDSTLTTTCSISRVCVHYAENLPQTLQYNLLKSMLTIIRTCPREETWIAMIDCVTIWVCKVGTSEDFVRLLNVLHQFIGARSAPKMSVRHPFPLEQGDDSRISNSHLARSNAIYSRCWLSLLVLSQYFDTLELVDSGKGDAKQSKLIDTMFDMILQGLEELLKTPCPEQLDMPAVLDGFLSDSLAETSTGQSETIQKWISTLTETPIEDALKMPENTFLPPDEIFQTITDSEQNAEHDHGKSRPAHVEDATVEFHPDMLRARIDDAVKKSKLKLRDQQKAPSWFYYCLAMVLYATKHGGKCAQKLIGKGSRTMLVELSSRWLGDQAVTAQCTASLICFPSQGEKE